MIDITSSCVGDMSPDYLASYGNKEVKPFPLKPGSTYGPFYYTGGKNFQPVVSANERNTFLGLKKPKDKNDAENLYNLKKWGNTLEYVHEVMIQVPNNVTDAVIFVGPVDGGTGRQLNMNRAACPCVVVAKIETLL